MTRLRRFRPCMTALLCAAACYGPTLEDPHAGDPAIVRIDQDSLAVGLSVDLQLTATRTDLDGAPKPGRFYWTSRNPAIASVSSAGVVHGRAPGATWILVSDSRNVDSLRLGVTVRFSTVTAGMDVSCGIAAPGGEVLCWGWNGVGSTGIGQVGDTSVPMLVTAERSSNLATGAGSSCSLRGASLWCWGYNGVGQLGDGTASNRMEPVAVADTLAIRKVIMGSGATSCALDARDRLLCWGWNGYGQLLIGGPGLNAHRPVVTAAPASVAAITTGGGHVCALDEQGAAWCWGRNEFGELGTGDFDARYDPVRVGTVPPLVSIVAGLTHTCGRTAAGQVWCWGDNALGQLGADVGAVSAVPVLAAGGRAFDDLSTSWNHTCALSSGAAWCWGLNSDGQLGSGDHAGGPQPRAVAGGLVFSALRTGVSHTCGLTTSGEAWCWGSDLHGALGDGQRLDEPAPVKVAFQP